MSANLKALGIDRLTVRERLDLIEAIWDSLPEQVQAAEVPAWQLPELIRRRVAADTDRLGILAMEFHSNRDEDSCRRVATEYAEVVARLIASGTWDEAPSPVDWLPDEYMPKAFYDYWLAEEKPTP